MNGERLVTKNPLVVARLSEGEGIIGQGRLVRAEDELEYSRGLVSHNKLVTIANTAGCIDGRRDLRFANGLSDPDDLYNRVTFYLTGGLGLAATKAVMAADAYAIKDARSVNEVYERVVQILTDNDLEDGGHENCGASLNMKKSVEAALQPDIVIANLSQIMEINNTDQGRIHKLYRNKEEKIATGFLDGWDNKAHEKFLAANFPQNFATLETANDRFHGHHERSVFVATKGGFAKNAFISDTGDETFCLTAELAEKIAGIIGVNDDEKRLLYLAFLDDLLNVGTKLVVRGMPAFVGCNPELQVAA